MPAFAGDSRLLEKFLSGFKIPHLLQLSPTLVFFLPPSSIYLSQALRAKPGMIISWLLLSSKEQYSRFFQCLD